MRRCGRIDECNTEAKEKSARSGGNRSEREDKY